MPINYIKRLKYNWKLYSFDKTLSDNYFNNYQNNSELDFMQDWGNKFNDTYLSYNVNNILKSNQIIYGNLKKQHWSFFDFIDNKEYQVFNIIMLSSSIIVFFFNINNPCFLIQNFFYMDFFYFGRINQKNLIQISFSTAGNDIELPTIESNLNFIYNIGLSNKFVNFKKKMYFFGMISNIGHHLWNEVTGLIHFISNKKNIELIDGVVIGSFDFFNMEKYLNDTFNIKTVKFNINDYPICLNIYPVIMNSIILDDNCKTRVKTLLNYTPQNNICLHTKQKQLVFDIRTCSRVILNITETYNFIINQIYKLIDNKYVLNIVFTGRFLTNLDDIDILTDKDIISQNKIVDKIINNFKYTNIIFDNLIGKKFIDINNYISNADLMIVIFGSSSPNLVNWIHGTKCLAFIQPLNYNVYNSIQYDVLDNKTVTHIPYKCFDINDNHNIIVKPGLFYVFLYNNFLKFI